MEQLFETLHRIATALNRAGIPYRVIGGVAVFLHVAERDPLAARITRDIDLAINRADLDSIRSAALSIGLEYRHVAGVDMLVDPARSAARSAIHLVMVREKVRPGYPETVPGFSAPVEAEGVLLAPVAGLVRMKLTSYYLKDRVHIQDLDAVGLVTPSIENQLSDELRHRLAEIRTTQ